MLDKGWQVTGVGVVTEQGDGQVTEVATDTGYHGFVSEMDRGNASWSSRMTQW